MLANSSNFYCGACKQKTLDEYGDHALSCKYMGDVIGRHDAVRDALDEIAKEAGFQCFKEVGVMRDRMGDVVIRNFNMGRDLFVDVSVAHTLCPSYVDRSAKNALSAASLRVEQKNKKFEAQSEVVNFKAFVVETLGGIHKDAVEILKKIADIVAVGTFMEPHKVLQRLQTKISMVLQRGNARLLAARYLALEG